MKTPARLGEHCQGQGVGPRVSRWPVESKMMAPGTRDCVNMTGAFLQHRGMTMDTLIAHVLRRGNSGWNKSYWLVYWSCIWNPEGSSCKVGQSIWAICSKISVKFVVQIWQRITVREQLPVASVQCQPIFILSVNCDIRWHATGDMRHRWGMDLALNNNNLLHLTIVNVRVSHQRLILDTSQNLRWFLAQTRGWQERTLVTNVTNVTIFSIIWSYRQHFWVISTKTFLVYSL